MDQGWEFKFFSGIKLAELDFSTTCLLIRKLEFKEGKGPSDNQV